MRLQYLVVRPFNAVGSGELPDVRKTAAWILGWRTSFPISPTRRLIKQTPFKSSATAARFGPSRTRATSPGGGLDSRARAAQRRLQHLRKQHRANIGFGSRAKDLGQGENDGEVFPAIKSMPVPPADVQFRVGVSTKLTEATGWRPAYDIDAIIEDTYSFVSSALGESERLAE